jgi:MFS family permease
MGLFATATAVGGVVGPLVAGVLVQHLGFQLTFYAFAVLATFGATVFTWFVPETRSGDGHGNLTGDCKRSYERDLDLPLHHIGRRIAILRRRYERSTFSVLE